MGMAGEINRFMSRVLLLSETVGNLETGNKINFFFQIKSDQLSSILLFKILGILNIDVSHLTRYLMSSQVV